LHAFNRIFVSQITKYQVGKFYCDVILNYLLATVWIVRYFVCHAAVCACIFASFFFIGLTFSFRFHSYPNLTQTDSKFSSCGMLVQHEESTVRALLVPVGMGLLWLFSAQRTTLFYPVRRNCSAAAVVSGQELEWAADLEKSVPWEKRKAAVGLVEAGQRGRGSSPDSQRSFLSLHNPLTSLLISS